VSYLVSYFADVLEILHKYNAIFVIIILYCRQCCPYLLYDIDTAIRTCKIKLTGREA